MSIISLCWYCENILEVKSLFFYDITNEMINLFCQLGCDRSTKFCRDCVKQVADEFTRTLRAAGRDIRPISVETAQSNINLTVQTNPQTEVLNKDNESDCVIVYHLSDDDTSQNHLEQQIPQKSPSPSSSSLTIDKLDKSESNLNMPITIEIPQTLQPNSSEEIILAEFLSSIKQEN